MKDREKKKIVIVVRGQGEVSATKASGDRALRTSQELEEAKDHRDVIAQGSEKASSNMEKAVCRDVGSESGLQGLISKDKQK